MAHRLPRRRRKRRRVNISGLMARFHDGVAAIEASLEPFAQHWDDWNHDALRDDGPLWVVFGDSVSQGIGASSPETSYAALALADLRDRTGQPWRLINLSVSGARLRDVADDQIPLVAEFDLRPDLVSSVIGSNDYIWRRDIGAIARDAHAVTQAFPEGTILSRVSEARPDRRRVAINEVFEAAQSQGRVRLYEAWDWPTGHGMWAEDNFHPNDRAHRHLAENLVHAFQRYGVIGTG